MGKGMEEGEGVTAEEEAEPAELDYGVVCDKGGSNGGTRERIIQDERLERRWQMWWRGPQ